jgi:hypothetical protein
MSLGNGNEGSHSEAGISRREKGDGVEDMGVDDRPDGVELKVGVMGVPAVEEASERLEEEVGNDNFRGMAKATEVKMEMEMTKTLLVYAERRESQVEKVVGTAES